jgi:hypothetical protein
MKRDAFSDAVFPRWMRVSSIGLLVSVSAAVGGELVRNALQGNTSTMAVVARIAAAAIHGAGLGFSILFLLLVVAGLLYAVIHRRKPPDE